jgi:hypothetical protein
VRVRAKRHSLVALFFTILLAIMFTFLQGFEYVTVFMVLVFIWLQVFIGSVFLYVQ